MKKQNKRKQRRKGVNGRAKGSAFERRIASTILKATEDTGFHFGKRHVYRTPMSGGHLYAKEISPADLTIHRKLLKVFPFAVEAKCHRQIKLEHFARKVARHEKSWMEKQAIDQVLKALESMKSKTKRYPLVIMKENQGEMFAITTREALDAILLKVSTEDWGMSFRYLEQKWVIVYWKDFLKHWRRMLKVMKGRK